MLELPRLFAHEGTRIASLGAIEVRLGAPVAFVQATEEPRLEAQGVHIAIVTHGGGVVAVFLPIGEGVASRGIEVFAAHREVELWGEALLVEEGGIEGGEGARLECRLEVGRSLGSEGGSTRGHIERRCRREALGRLEDGAALSIIYRDGLHIVQREASEVNLSVLRITQLKPIVEDPHVLRAHTAHIHRLESPDATVVLDLHTSKVAQGIGDTHRTESLQVTTAKRLGGDDILRDKPLPHHDPFEDVDAVCMRRGTHLGKGEEHETEVHNEA